VTDPRFADLRASLGPGDLSFVRAPGRVNLIGDHTDYQEGFCLPVAIDRDVLVAFRRRDDELALVGSLDVDDAVDDSWRRTVAAVLDALEDRGRTMVGFDATVASTIPIGSGLSSSAAFEVALAMAAATVAELALDGRTLALVAQEAEHRASGVPCGVMDQMASVFGRAGHALLLDCRTLAIEPVPLPDGAAIVVVHSGLPRRLETSAYAARRAACEAAAARLGVRTLRDALPSQVSNDPIAAHVVSENARVLTFVDALTRCNLDACGQVMLASHASLRDNFRVSTVELDTLVTLAVDEGAFGARLTGAGFGGCVVALVPASNLQSFTEAVCTRYRAATRLEPTAFPVRAADGATLVA
jgi:galactokinase